jgi:DNA-binding response OmpR family regulator
VAGRIAVIDDEAPNRQYLTNLLSGAGFKVDSAGGGAEGVSLVEKERPDLVLLDLLMPEVDGFAVCERIRKGPVGPHTQIVVLTGLEGVDEKVRALELGADEYLVKPVENRELVTRIKTMMARAQELRQQGSNIRGRLTVVAGAKGGIGTSTVATNLAATLAAGKDQDEVVLADLAVPVGALATMLNIPAPNRWLWKEIMEEGSGTAFQLAGFLMRSQQYPSIRLLPGVRPGSPYRALAAESFSGLAGMLRGLAPHVVVDVGNQPSPFVPPLLREADVILIVVEPEILCVELTTQFLNRLQETGILGHRMRLCISNPHGSLQLSRSEVAAALKMEAVATILYQRDEFSAASKRRLPLVVQQPQGPTATQFQELAKALAQV